MKVKKQLSAENRQYSEIYRLIEAYELSSDSRTRGGLLKKARQMASEWHLEVIKEGDSLKLQKAKK